MLGLAAFSVFGQETERPIVMYEAGSGYNIGINMDGAIPLEIRMTIPFDDFGFILAGGVDFAENNGGHGFIGGTYFIFNNDKVRLPISLGFSISGNQRDSYLGISGLVSYHYVLAKDIYIGFNVEINYNFNHRYTDIIGNGEGMATNGVDGWGNPITTFPSPKAEVVDHWGNYINIRPTICIGYQLK
jgi:hypothetical protein